MRLYAILRDDLKMTPGKSCSQAGHAYLMSFLAASKERQTDYHVDGLGTKICLLAKSQEWLERTEHWAKSHNLPCFLVTDSGRNTTFGGVPTVSALGVGPLYPNECAELRRFQLLP